VLRQVGATMRAALRPYDIPCRYGGEEFCAILPQTDAETAFIVAERLREAVAAAVVDNLRVTISLGVATNAAWREASASTLLEAADAALYRAKDGGRNQTILASTPDQKAAG
jgi:diguanylate cyclase (GGDEF)-like protein